MPSEIAAQVPTDAASAVASRRILRLALGTTLSLLFSQVINWQLSYLAPVFTMFLLAIPLPAPTLKKGIGFCIALLLPVCAGLAMIPFLDHARWAGITLVAIALYYSFYYTAKGGSPVMGAFMSVGLTLVVTIGSVSLDVLLMLIEGLALGAIFGLIFVWIAHALLPELPPDPAMAAARRPAAPKPDLQEARRSAFRSMMITFPIALLFLFASGSPAYAVVMIKVASMGQQASTDHSRAMGRSLLGSTFWGGVGAILAWQVLSIWPSLLMYTMLIAIAGLLYGARIFAGRAMHPKAGMWSYAFLTMIVVLAPAVMDSQGGSAAGAAFYTRLFLFVLIAVYGSIAVAVFDAFWKKKPLND